MKRIYRSENAENSNARIVRSVYPAKEYIVRKPAKAFADELKRASIVLVSYVSKSGRISRRFVSKLPARCVPLSCSFEFRSLRREDGSLVVWTSPFMFRVDRREAGPGPGHAPVDIHRSHSNLIRGAGGWLRMGR
jgi:hypothetical protein